MAAYREYMDDLDREVGFQLAHGGKNVDELQRKQIEHLTKHVRVLWNHIERLEAALAVTQKPAAPVTKELSLASMTSVALRAGAASIVLKADGTIQIKGKDITIDGSGKVTAKAASDMTLKGSRILQN